MTAIDRLSALASDEECHWNLAGPADQDCVDVSVADLRTALDRIKALEGALAKSERQASRMEAALEENGNAQAWRDGFKACAEVVNSVRFHATWGPKASPEDGVRMALESVRESVSNSVAAQEARAALTPPPERQ